MTRLSCGVYDWIGYEVMPSVPHLPGTEPPRAPVQPGAQPEQWLVAVHDFPSGRFRGVLWEARIESRMDRLRSMGGNRLTISAPTTRQSMRILGTPIPGEVDQSGGQLYGIPNAVSLELVLGSTIDGLARRRYVIRDQVTFSGGRVTMTGAGIIGGLTSDRVIGAPTRRNLIPSNASFEHGNLDGWRKHGALTADVVPDGPDGAYCVKLRGKPGRDYLERRVTYPMGEQPWGRQRIAGVAQVKLPTGIDIEDYGLVSIAVFEGATQVWPIEDLGDLEAGIVTGEMPRGSWVPEPVVGIGYLPKPPYIASVRLRLHPVSEDHDVYYDGGQIIRRENTSTVVPVDLVNHPAKLFAHAQLGRGKSDWKVGVVEGAPIGIVEVGTWWHEDGEPLNEALEGLCGRGLDVFDLAGPGRRVASQARQGADRTGEIGFPEWEIIGEAKWDYDPGSQRTAARAVSSAGSIFGGADVGLIDTSKAGGQAIDVILAGPVGMNTEQLKAWLRTQLASLSTAQAGTVILVRPELGHRVEVGDTIRPALRMGAAAHLESMRITEKVHEPGRPFIALSLGTEPGDIT